MVWGLGVRVSLIAIRAQVPTDWLAFYRIKNN